MPERFSEEAILPCLLDRLCDQDPDSQRESSYRHSLTLGSFRQSVLRDLSWLLNTPCHSPGEPIFEFPEAKTSVLNYGKPDFTGKTASTVNPHQLEVDIARAIRLYEPRILPDSISVQAVPENNSSSPNRIAFEIRGLLWANPLPEEFHLQTTVDLETGQCLV